ncbi:PREDICTED: putative pumilio homolog 7, chloroplastic [Camelina sativa]|uniref:Pumilio homolog 7, chloroplastic n=1 Tax=Camelina sativa TaxID=90675 RepID=A0ABM1Q7Z4_CAMSA|nr:PREDICTED: putative pumilio homolog 7, chloroplastic [Camelina sativa]
MKMDEFREGSVASSPSTPLRTPLHSPTLFHEDFSYSNRFSFNSSSDYSLSTSFSNGFCSPEDSSSPFASPPFNGILPKHNHTSSPVSYHHNDLLFRKDQEKSVVVNGDDLGLCEDLYRMNIKEDVEEDLRYGRAETHGDHLGSIPNTVDPLYNFTPKHYESNNGVILDGAFVSRSFPCGFFNPTKEPSVNHDSWFNNTQNNSGFDQRKKSENNPKVQDSSIANTQQIGWPSYYSNSNGGTSPYINGQEIFGMGSNRGGMREYSAQPQQPEISYNHQSYRTTSDMLPLFCQGTQVPMVSKCSEPFSSDDSFFMDGHKSLDHHRTSTTRAVMSDNGTTTEICHPSLPNMCDIQGYVYLMAKDQHGCRFLQRIFDEGTSVDAMIIFNEVIAHVVELMMDPFGNYLMQKLLDVCTEEQRTQIVLVATAEPGQLIRISLNAYGTRVVQRLVETIRTGKQISLVKSALRPGFLDLIKDLNGNHVIQRCLQCLSTEDNKFIFDAATKFCTEIATHRHGCCVLQKCIAYSMRQQREKLISEISRNSLLLAQDPFGNYAVQFVIELRIPSAVAMMLAQLKGHYVQLSMQKFSSHMVERCLMHCPESRPQIVRELVSVSHFDQLLQDPYANFVIQAALAATKGPLHASLVEVIRPHSILRNNPYCKRIFSRNLLKK